MPTARFIELTLHAILRFLPYLLLMYDVFKDKLRFSKAFTTIAIVIMTALRCLCGYAPFYDSGILSRPNPGIIILVLLCFLFIRDHFGKSLFTMLMFVNISGFTQTAAKYIEGIFFPEYAVQLHRWTNTLTLTWISAVVLIPLFFYVRRIYIRTIRQEFPAAAWNGLWFIPFTLYAVWYRNSYFTGESHMALSLTSLYMIYTFLISAGGMVIYTTVTRLINTYAENIRLQEKEYVLTLQQTQYQHLQERIEETRVARHDMRQHLHMISALLNDKKYDALEAYINRCQTTLPESTAITYCDHYAVNALLHYFAELAEAHGIRFSAQVALPAALHIPDNVLAVLIGNLLENAVEASANEMAGVITVRGRLDEDAVFFKVVNTATARTEKTPDGMFRSTKRDGQGIGLRSVRSIVEEYDGILKIRHEAGTFSVSVLLKIPVDAIVPAQMKR